MAKPAYRRVVVKVSGEALCGDEGGGIDLPTIDRIAADIAASARHVQLGVVVGGGNLMRGAQVNDKRLSRPVADSMGMIATVMNALALEDALRNRGCDARIMSALAMPEICETFERQRALRHLARKRVLVFAGGLGMPFLTTDTTAVMRGAEIGADAVLKATNVDGVYSADPKKNPKAKRYDRLSHAEAIERNLKVMDPTAFTLARENRMPIIVFSIRAKGAIEAVLRGKGRATIVG